MGICRQTLDTATAVLKTLHTVTTQGRRRHSVHSVLGHCRFLKSYFGTCTFLKDWPIRHLNSSKVSHCVVGLVKFNLSAIPIELILQGDTFKMGRTETHILKGV